MSKLITSYPGPDLDGMACIFGYAEFLDIKGEEVFKAVYGKPTEDSKYILERFSIETPRPEDKEYEEAVIVDVSFPESVPDDINTEDIVKIIDHRENHKIEEFPNAEAENELVGAAATLVAEKFYEHSLEISPISANLLYTAILDNTVYLKADVTTERDRKMVEWLEDKEKVQEELGDILKERQSVAGEPVEQLLEEEYYEEIHHGNSIGTTQIEASDSKEFIEENRSKIVETLQRFKRERNLDYAFLTTVDIDKETNTIITADKETEELFSNSLDLEFENLKAEDNQITLRKQIMPKIKGELVESND